METAGIFVSALAELAAGVKIGEHQLDGRHLELRVHIDRNPAPVVTDGNRAIDVHGDVDLAAITGEVFVDRVIQHLENTMVQTAFIRVADIHAGAFSDGLETLELVDLGGVVPLSCTDSSRTPVG